MPDTESIATTIITQAKEISRQATSKIAQQGATLSINEFFPELQAEEYAFRTNMPRGVTVPQFCIWGRQAIFDLTPLSEDQFVKTHRIDIRTALA